MTPDPKIKDAATPAKPARKPRTRKPPANAREIEAAVKKANAPETPDAPKPAGMPDALSVATPTPAAPTAPVVPPEAEQTLAVRLYGEGKTIAVIARTIRKSHDQVRKILDASSVDYSKDKNATAAAPPASAAAKGKVVKTQAERLDAFITRTATGDLSARRRKLVDTLMGNQDVAKRISAIVSLQASDQEAYGRALLGLAGFLWSCES